MRGSLHSPSLNATHQAFGSLRAELARQGMLLGFLVLLYYMSLRHTLLHHGGLLKWSEDLSHAEGRRIDAVSMCMWGYECIARQMLCENVWHTTVGSRAGVVAGGFRDSK